MLSPFDSEKDIMLSGAVTIEKNPFGEDIEY